MKPADTRKGTHTHSASPGWVPEGAKLLPTVELVVDHVLQPLQPLEDRLPVHQVWNFAIPGSQSLVRDAPDLDELLGSVLDPAVDREQDNPHKHQDVDGQQSFDFACHSHERRIGSGLQSSPAAARVRWPALPPCSWSVGGLALCAVERRSSCRGPEGNPVSTADSSAACSRLFSAGVTWRMGALLTRLADTERRTLASATYYERKTTPCNLQMQYISLKQRDKPPVS